MKSTAELKRPYRQTARAEAAEANARRIVEAFQARLERQWFDEIRLDDIARDAAVTVQTVIRRFGGKEGLLDATVELMTQEVEVVRATPPGDVRGAAHAVLEHYELTGDLVIRILAQEDLYPALRRMADFGRTWHRDWVARVFATALQGLPAEVAQRRLDGLVVATDLYVWKLVRRDMGRPAAEVQALMERLIGAVLADLPVNLPQPESRHD